MPNLFQKTIERQNDSPTPPVWMMRQAGRYHKHYQELRKKHSFMDLCKVPELSCETTMGPIRDFDFDAAILFSDLLFPLEYLGMNLEYAPGPKLEWHLKKLSDCERISDVSTDSTSIRNFLKFQSDSLGAIKKELSIDKGLIGFVGTPLTLFFYSVEGSHKGDLSSAIAGLTDGRFEKFNEKIIPFMIENIILQAEAGPDCISIMDTCAGEISLDHFREINMAALSAVLDGVREKLPNFPIQYYSKGTSFDQWDLLTDLPIDGIGVDWNTPMKDILDRYSERFSIQGNVDPHWMVEPWNELEPKLREYFKVIQNLPLNKRSGWICGLGHGLTPPSNEDSIRNFVKLVREIFN